MDHMAKKRPKERKFPESVRWLGIGVRTLHIAFAAIVFGGAVSTSGALHQFPWQHLAIGTGLVLLLYEWLHDPNWPHCGKAVAVYLHLALLGLVHIFPEHAVTLLWGVVGIGSIGSHMPRHFRHWSLFYGPYRTK